MAFDHRALVSVGFWTADDATASETFCLLLSLGLWDAFPTGELLVAIMLGLGRHGFCLTMD